MQSVSFLSIPRNLRIGPESHSVHKLKTTKIIVEESCAPEEINIQTITNVSEKNEVSVEEADCFIRNEHKVDKLKGETFANNDELSILKHDRIENLEEKVKIEINSSDDKISEETNENQVAQEPSRKTLEKPDLLEKKKENSTDKNTKKIENEVMPVQLEGTTSTFYQNYEIRMDIQIDLFYITNIHSNA